MEPVVDIRNDNNKPLSESVKIANEIVKPVIEAAKRIKPKRVATGLVQVKARHELSEQILHDLGAELQPREVLVQYIQSVLVWNLKSHLLAIMIIFYLVVSYLDMFYHSLELFHSIGLSMMAIAVVPTLRKTIHRVIYGREPAKIQDIKALTQESQHLQQQPQWTEPSQVDSRMLTIAELKRRKDEVMGKKPEAWIVWPEDATDFSAETGPLSLGTLTKKVKLYDMTTLLHMMVDAQLEVMQAIRAMRVLRFQHPTLFLANIMLVWVAGFVLTSFFSGRAILLLVGYGVLLIPGFYRRRILQKLRFRLEQNKWGRMFVSAVFVDVNPNLEETNTSNVLTFINTQSEKKKKPPGVVVKPAN